MTKDVALQSEAPGAGFSDSVVEANGIPIRYREGGAGEALVCLHGGHGPRLSRTHEMLARSYRVIAFEMPGFGQSVIDEQAASARDLAASLNDAVVALDIERYSLMGGSIGATVALWMAITRPEPVDAAVVMAPTAIRPDDAPQPDGSAEQVAGLLYAHPEKLPPLDDLAPDVEARQRALARGLIGPPRDAGLEARLAELEMPVLAMFGTNDRIAPPEIARHYSEILPNCHLMMVYDAAHAMDEERPEAVASVITHFLARHEQFLVKEESGILHP